AGRGTDIQLGGNFDMRVRRETHDIADEDAKQRRIEAIRREVDEAKQVALRAGGLFVMGTERHESRRIDNQLRGRSGRQGDPGASHFFLSLEDDLMRIFGSDRMDGMLQRLGLKEGEAIVHSWVNKALEKAQQRVEARNFEIRKNLLRYDNVMNDQRKVVYEQRKDLMRQSDVSQTVQDMRHEVIENLVARAIPKNSYAEQWDNKLLHEEALRLFALDLPIEGWFKEEGIDEESIEARLMEASDRKMAEKTATIGPAVMRVAEKSLLLQLLDQIWKEHLLSLDHLRHGIGFRAYGQRNPLDEYKREAFELFEKMLDRLRETVTGVLSHIQIRVTRPEDAALERSPQPMQEGRQDPALAEAGQPMPQAPMGQLAMAVPTGAPRAPAAAMPPPSAPQPGIAAARASIAAQQWGKVPRNSLCPCGSGKKFKHCHGKS
ncbi:MAG: SEC-C metal-binding domain-containing protein, partial [Dongiaceae bacterium]